MNDTYSTTHTYIRLTHRHYFLHLHLDPPLHHQVGQVVSHQMLQEEVVEHLLQCRLHQADPATLTTLVAAGLEVAGTGTESS